MCRIFSPIYLVHAYIVTIAARAYKKALSTLSTLTAHPPSQTYDPALVSGNTNSKSLLSSFLPNFQGQGPIGSAIRIALKLHQQTFRRLATGFGKEGLGLGSKRKDDEMRGKAIKVLDLLQHSAELGNTDALFTLAKVSLVRAFRVQGDSRITLTFLAVSAHGSFRFGPKACVRCFHRPLATDW